MHRYKLRSSGGLFVYTVCVLVGPTMLMQMLLGHAWNIPSQCQRSDTKMWCVCVLPQLDGTSAAFCTW
jgi:hypothetical protein